MFVFFLVKLILRTRSVWVKWYRPCSKPRAWDIVKHSFFMYKAVIYNHDVLKSRHFDGTSWCLSLSFFCNAFCDSGLYDITCVSQKQLLVHFRKSNSIVKVIVYTCHNFNKAFTHLIRIITWLPGFFRFSLCVNDNIQVASSSSDATGLSRLSAFLWQTVISSFGSTSGKPRAI